MIKSGIIKGVLLSVFSIITSLAWSQLLVSNAGTAQQWVQNTLIGQGVVVNNVTYSGATMAAGTFTGNTNIGIGSGVILTSGDINLAPGPNNSGSAGFNNNFGGDPDLAAVANGTINDACILEFDFIPQTSTVSFRYAFGSDEYPEFVGSSFNDVFGFFISGPNINGPYTNNSINIALIPATVTPVSINNVNQNLNNGFYVDNTGGATIQYDGFTTVLTAEATVVPCMTYHIKLAISDVGDHIYDSGVFLEENSFTSTSITVNTSFSTPGNPAFTAPLAIEGCRKAILTFTIPYALSTSQWIHIDSIFGTAINGVNYTLIPDSVEVLPYHLSASIIINPISDGIVNPTRFIKLTIKTSICANGDTTIVIPIADYNNIVMTKRQDTAVCETPTQLWVNPSMGAPPYNVQWTPMNTLNNAQILNPVALPEKTTTYYVTVKDSTRCSIANDSIKVTYNYNPVISFKPDPYSGCDSLVVNFDNKTTPAIQTWRWDYGDGGSDTIQNPTHIFHYQPGVGPYSVQLQATTAAGCHKVYNIPGLISVYAQPDASFTMDPDESFYWPGKEITFTNTSLPNVGAVAWLFGDSLNGTANTEIAKYTYDKQGDYEIWLYVTEEHGCKDSISKKIKVVDYDLTIPNVITPNGDMKNDAFVIKNLENFPSSNLYIYDRWGKKVFEASPYKNDWDGGKLPDGTYYYQLYYKRNSEFRVGGTITLVR